ncbi:hypothetical protein N9383_06695 [Granulosicoccus sp.]|nr:hypothetical protein [Granulosicoccus sp.]
MLTRTDDEIAGWYPVRILKLENYLNKYIQPGTEYTGISILKKDLAYNLQYLEFQNRIIQDIKLSSVLYTQTIKAIVLIGCSIVESLLHYSIAKVGVRSTVEWKDKVTFKGNQKNLDGELVRINTTIQTKLSQPEFIHMTLDSMIKKAKSHSILGSRPQIYRMLENLRKLRNRIHLQPDIRKRGTDWTTFDTTILNETYVVMYAILTSSLFHPTALEIEYFSYLDVTFG